MRYGPARSPARLAPARLAAGVVPPPGRRALVSSPGGPHARPARRPPARLPAVALPSVAARADRHGPLAQRAVEEPVALGQLGDRPLLPPGARQEDRQTRYWALPRLRGVRLPGGGSALHTGASPRVSLRGRRVLARSPARPDLSNRAAPSSENQIQPVPPSPRREPDPSATHGTGPLRAADRRQIPADSDRR